MKADVEKRFGKHISPLIQRFDPKGKTIDAIYTQLMKVPDFKNLSFDRQGEIAVKVLQMIQGK